MRYVVITGATKGIGRAVAEEFAKAGNHLFICSRDLQDLQSTSEALRLLNADTTVKYLVSDLSKQGEVAKFASEIKAHFPYLDILVNNAGLFISGNIVNEAEGALEAMLQVNLLSVYNLTRALLPMMMPRKSGEIFNMCSIASFMAYPNGGSYSISKFALLGMSKVLRAELKEHGIKVTAVMPGATWSDSFAGADFPHERLMLAADVAQAIHSASLLSPQAVVEEIIIRPQLGDL